MPLLRMRVELPDRPGALGSVARTLGAAGADIAQVVVLERSAGRAIDDFTIGWPDGASLDVLCEAIGLVRGVVITGVWRTDEVPGIFADVEVIGRMAANPANGVAMLVDAAPKIFGSDWAAMLAVDGTVVWASPRAPERPACPGRSGNYAFTGEDGVRYVAACMAGGERSLLLARVAAPPFHRMEVERLIQLATAADAILGAAVTA